MAGAKVRKGAVTTTFLLVCALLYFPHSNFERWWAEFTTSIPPVVAKRAQSESAPRRRSSVAYITYAHLKDTKRFDDLIFPSMDTWLKGNGTYYVVLGNIWREAYHDGLCKKQSVRDQYCRRLTPIFVDCPEGYYGESPCCKNEKGMLQMLLQHGNEYDWFMYMDDDMYIRQEYLKQYLEPLDPSDVMILASGKNGGRLTKLGEPSFSFGNAKYPCSGDVEYMYPWGQPVIYSRAALERAAVGFRLGGLVKQCLEYGVTHDVGNGVFHWMFQFPEVRIPFPWRTEDATHLHFGAHSVGKPEQLNFTEAEAFFFRGKKVTFTHLWHNVTGFRGTAVYRDHGDPWTWTEWHTMNVSDCAGNDTTKLGGPFVAMPKPWTRPKPERLRGRFIIAGDRAGMERWKRQVVAA